MKRLAMSLVPLLAAMLLAGSAVASDWEPSPIELDAPTVDCASDPSGISVEVNLAVVPDLSGYSFTVEHWAEMASPFPSYWPGQFEQVESWTAHIGATNRKNRKPPPTSHVLVSGNPTTWSHRRFITDPSMYQEGSRVYRVQVNAHTTSKKVAPTAAWGTWTFNCADGDLPISHTRAWELDESTEDGRLATN